MFRDVHGIVSCILIQRMVISELKHPGSRKHFFLESRGANDELILRVYEILDKARKKYEIFGMTLWFQ